jgi:hypothetical protein
MAFWHKWFARNRDEPVAIPTGRMTQISTASYSVLSPYRSRTTQILETLRMIPEEAQAIDFLRKVTPDVSMAVWNFVRLANQGHEMHFYDIREKNRRLPRAEAKWREFAERVNETSNAGLDGLIDILHQSAFLRGAMAVEVEVNSDRTDIVDIYPVIPQTIYWYIEERNGHKVWIPYQQIGMNKVSLEPGKANFFWVPTDPDIDDPRGNLVLTPVLQAVDFQLQVLQDLAAVLHHQGWSRNDISINLERLMKIAPAEVKMNAAKMRAWLKEKWEEVVNAFKNLEPESDYIHFDDVTVTLAPGANAGRGLDVRAVAELVDTQLLSGSKQLAIFMNRNQGITESWGSVQFKIMVSAIASVQRGSKRLIEEVARLWLRVNGIQGIPKFTHNTIDWQSEEQRWTVKLLQQEFYSIAQLMGWVSADEAAQEVIGAEKAVSDVPSEAIRISLSMGGERIATSSDGKGGLRQTSKIPRSRLGIVK